MSIELDSFHIVLIKTVFVYKKCQRPTQKTNGSCFSQQY